MGKRSNRSGCKAMLSQQEKAVILCEFFKAGYLQYESALSSGYDTEENYWYGFGFETSDGYKEFDLRFTTENGDIYCQAMRCHPNKDGSYSTDTSKEWTIL